MFNLNPKLRKASRTTGRVFMASFFAYFLTIFFDGLIAAFTISLRNILPIWALKWILAPITLELGTIFAMLISIYLLVKFAAIHWIPATIGTAILLELWNFLTKWIFGLTQTYSTSSGIITRILGFLIYTYLGYLLWRRFGFHEK